MIAALSILLAATASGHLYSLPQCHETVETGAWWPDVDCARDEYRRADARLNQAWKPALRSNAPRRSGLVASERKWISELQATCAAVNDLSGEREFIEYRRLACKYELTRERTSYLAKLR